MVLLGVGFLGPRALMVHSRIVGIFLLVATLFAHGCAVQLISEQSVENKLVKVKLG